MLKTKEYENKIKIFPRVPVNTPSITIALESKYVKKLIYSMFSIGILPLYAEINHNPITIANPTIVDFLLPNIVEISSAVLSIANNKIPNETKHKINAPISTSVRLTFGFAAIAINVHNAENNIAAKIVTMCSNCFPNTNSHRLIGFESTKSMVSTKDGCRFLVPPQTKFLVL